MVVSSKRFVAVMLGLGMASAARGAGDADFQDHPAARQLQQLFPTPPPATGVRPTGLTKADYLALIQGGVDFFKSTQRADGAIIDPVSRKEVQYSTPAFGAAAGLLVKESNRADLLDPASRALTFALTALVNKKAADNHSDFYIPLIMQAYGSLKEQVTPAIRAGWEKQLQAVDPRTMYRADLRNMNWNIVSFSGEVMRRANGLVAADLREDEQHYLDDAIANHLQHFTKYGMYEDPNAPLAYDAFSRLWLEQVILPPDAKAAGYRGPVAGKLEGILKNGALSSLLLLSPTGEWASGGRSAFHQWNEAELAVICEIEAGKWKASGREDVAGAFKRGARLALGSMKRWQRPTGEMFIVKNHAEPAERLGFESYSAHSQYNLLPMAMLAAAYVHADESIAERPIPAETGGYVFDMRDVFHKVAAAAGGYYVLIDTAADPHYNATGLQRIQKAGVAFSPLSDSTAGERAYGPNNALKLALSPGLEWQVDGNWISLSSFSLAENNAKRIVKEAALSVSESTPQRTIFSIDYALEPADGRHLIEQYTITREGVELATHLDGDPIPLRLRMPALISDGATATQITLNKGSAQISHAGCRLTWQLLGAMQSITPVQLDQKTVSHQGYMQPLIADVPAGTTDIRCRWSLEMKN